MPSYAFLAPFPLRCSFPNAPLISKPTSPRACTSPAPLYEPSIPPSSIPSSPFPTALYNTTLVHNIPRPRHSLSHPLDGDAYLVALSIQPSGAAWLRARFVRTRGFMRETKAARRIYRGAYGTPGIKGWDAPLKPKPTSSDGIFIWGRGKKRRVCAWGNRALPFAVDTATLVTKGPTALGAVLTDSQELISERATELVATPITVGDSVWVPGLSRAQTGRVLGVCLSEVDAEGEIRRLPRVDVPGKCAVGGFAIGSRYCVLIMHRRGQSGVLGGLFGGSADGGAPEVDVDFGSIVVVVPRDGTPGGVLRLPGKVVTHVVGVKDDGELSVEVLLMECADKVQTSTMGDARSSRLWTTREGNDQVRLRRGKLHVEVGVKGLTKKLEGKMILDEVEEDISLLDPAHSISNERGDGEGVFTVYNHAKNRAGLAQVGNAGLFVDVWTVEEDNYQVSGPLLSEDGKFVNVLVTREYPERSPARLMVFKVGKLAEGPIHTTELDLEIFGEIGCSSGGAWANEAVDWSEEGSKPVKSAYEIFDSKKWNDIESGFSSLGFGQ